MARANLRREDEFDRGREFITVRNFVCGGKTFHPGEPFDQTLVTVRRLRQMFDSHMIDIPKIASAERAAVTHTISVDHGNTAVEPQQPGDDEAPMTNEELVARLLDNDVVPRPNASREWLLRKVRELSGQ